MKPKGVAPIYIEGEVGTLLECIQSLRPGDELWVATSGRLANTRDRLREVFREVDARGAVIVDATTGLRSDGGATAVSDMVLDAAAEMVRDARAMTSAEARRIGALGGKIAKTPPMSREDAMKIWLDPRYGSSEAAAAIGISMPKAYRWLKARNVFAGRPRKDRSSEVIPPEMLVYFIRNGHKGAVKIGVTANLSGRLSALSHPMMKELKLLGTIEGGYGAEKEMHKRFAEYRIKGEWFKFEGKLKEFVESLGKPDPAHKKSKRRKT